MFLSRISLLFFTKDLASDGITSFIRRLVASKTSLLCWLLSGSYFWKPENASDDSGTGFDRTSSGRSNLDSISLGPLGFACVGNNRAFFFAHCKCESIRSQSLMVRHQSTCYQHQLQSNYPEFYESQDLRRLLLQCNPHPPCELE